MKTDKIVELSTKKAELRKKEVIDSINKMIKHGDKVTFYSVMKETKASKSYLYGNDEIRSLIELGRKQAVKPRSVKGNKVIIEAQRQRIKELETRVKELESENSESLKIKCDKLQKENQELKLQLKNSTYSYN